LTCSLACELRYKMLSEERVNTATIHLSEDKKRLELLVRKAFSESNSGPSDEDFDFKPSDEVVQALKMSTSLEMAAFYSPAEIASVKEEKSNADER
jgi:hypothetical protein